MKRVIFAFLFLAPVQTWAASPAGDVNAGVRLFKEGKYAQAVQAYQAGLKKSPESALVHYDLGTALYKKGDYAAAIAHLSKAAGTDIKDVRPAALYNLGNAFYKKGAAQEQENIDGAIKDLEQSLGNYQQVMNADAKDEDARYNHEFVKKELERLKKKKEEQKKQQQNQDQKQQPQDKQQDQQQQPQGGGQDKQQQEDQKKQEQQKQDQQQQQDQKKQGEQQDQQGRQDQQQEQASNTKEEMDKKEAKAALEDYQRNEEPKGLLNFIPKTKPEKPVAKDW